MLPIFHIAHESARVNHFHVVGFYDWFGVIGTNVEFEYHSILPTVSSLPGMFVGLEALFHQAGQSG
jgi:hypothetical protein